MNLSLSQLKVSLDDTFRPEWGSGRRHVSCDLFESTKRSIEERVKMPILRADEPSVDSYRVPLARNFHYCFYSLLSKKRTGESSADSSFAK